MSLDHDLGDDEHSTGYDVVLWIEEAVATQGFQPPKSRFTVLTHLQGRKWSSVS
ncbi:cyclic-phosphate processing receiver domain-containing protein [Vibrio vulnificus]|uniref:cyclic-phosphate processing receiver domain-containing protein n=1 Tax=Vibrio TaxID=662 RepID=UPI0027BAF8EA|nr:MULTISPECIES: cyclic-phosphate processing receiver domain-containing protein [Vibrio]